MRLIVATALLLTLSLAACGGDEPAATSNDATAEAATAAATEAAAEPAAEALPPMPVGDYRITSVTLGKAVDEEGQVRQPLDTFATADKIFVAVVGVGSSEGLTLAARWTAADGTEVAKAGQSLNPSTPTVATFSIAQPDPWPVGTYQVEISINGRVAETRSFQVQ